MEVILASCGNPDHFQDPYLPMWGCEDNRKVQVESIEDASKICVKFIRDNELGGGNWLGGQVLEDKQIIADIGYNGKVTLPGDKFYTAENVFQEFELYKL